MRVLSIEGDSIILISHGQWKYGVFTASTRPRLASTILGKVKAFYNLKHFQAHAWCATSSWSGGYLYYHVQGD